MWPPSRNGSIALEQLGPAPERADAARAAHLVGRDGDEVGAERLDVDDPVRRGLRRVDDHDRAALARPRGEALDRVDRAEAVRDEAGGDDLHVLELVERLEPQLAVVVERDQPEVGAGPLRDVLPRDEVRVVLELGDDDDVARLQLVQPPRVGDEVDALGRVAGEDDLARRRGVEEPAHLLARALERLGRALGELVDAAVHVRVRGLVERASSRRASAAASASSRPSRGTRAACRGTPARRSGSPRGSPARRASAVRSRPRWTS